MINIKNDSKKAEMEWGKSYDVLWKIINDKKLKVGAEIGVAYGGHSEKILKKTKSKLYCIDPYEKLSNYDDPMNISQKKFDKLYEFAKKRLSSFPGRVSMIRKTSQKALDDINEEIDFVYLDADHSYEGLLRDLTSWFFKVRDGGVISGHDYGHGNFPGVKKAVDEFFNRFNWEINSHESGVWWVEKKTINISFIMPAYNAEDTIQESIESIFKGNFKSGDELVIVDDCSTDKTSGVVSKLLKKHKEIKLISHSHNQGGGAARNTAVDHSKNELIFCLDSDNLLVKNSISKLKKFLIEKNSNIACFYEIRYFKKNKKSHSWIYKKNTYNFSDYLSSHVVPGSSGNYLYTKKSYDDAGGYPEFAGALDAWGFGVRQAGAGYKIHVLPDSYYLHRIGHESYWIRDSKKNNYSRSAVKILRPFMSKIRWSSRLYMYTYGRNKWFHEISSKRINAL